MSKWGEVGLEEEEEEEVEVGLWRRLWDYEYEINYSRVIREDQCKVTAPVQRSNQETLQSDIANVLKLPISEKITTALLFETVPDYLTCEICLDTLNSPLLATCCGQSFCQECVQKLPPHSNCPHCRKPLNTIEDMKSRRILSNVKMKCPYHVSNKCSWTGCTSDLQAHLKACVFKPVSCPNKCGLRRERQNIDVHCEYECKLRSVKCKYCPKKIIYKEMEDHITKCPRVPLPCPNKCSHPQILRQDMEKHISECPLQEVDCEYARFGCQYKPRRQEVSDHNKNDVVSHVALLARRVIELESHRTETLSDCD